MYLLYDRLVVLLLLPMLSFSFSKCHRLTYSNRLSSLFPLSPPFPSSYIFLMYFSLCLPIVSSCLFPLSFPPIPTSQLPLHIIISRIATIEWSEASRKWMVSKNESTVREREGKHPTVTIYEMQLGLERIRDPVHSSPFLRYKETGE